MKTRKIVATAVAVLTLSVGGMAAIVANPFAAGAATPATAAPTATHKGHPRLRHYLRDHRAAVVTIVATSIDIPRATLVKDLKDGQSIAQVAAANNVPLSTVTTALDNAGKAAVAKAEAAGKITSAQATKLDAHLLKAIARLENAHRK